MINIQGLGKSFQEHRVLDNIHLHVPERATHVVIGPSGSGKSSLLRCVGGLEPFQEGTVAVNGLEIGPTHDRSLPDVKKIRQYRQQSGFVFQQFNLFPHRTALENITEGPVQVLRRAGNEVEEQAYALLKKVRLENKAGRYPNELSGGEQQRVAIARALAMKPKCLLMDEPTSALDPEMVGEVLQVLKELAEEGQTLLIATHEMGFARQVADRVTMLDSGRVIETAIPEKMFRDPLAERTRLFLARVMHR